MAQFKSLKGIFPRLYMWGDTAYVLLTEDKDVPELHQEGHEVKDCTAVRVCKQCGKPGHTKDDCPERSCFQCLGRRHESNECPEYLQAFP